jgi:hypothetical protein
LDDRKLPREDGIGRTEVVGRHGVNW